MPHAFCVSYLISLFSKFKLSIRTAEYDLRTKNLLDDKNFILKKNCLLFFRIGTKSLFMNHSKTIIL